MSDNANAEAPAAKGGKKKLIIIIIAAVLVLVLLVGGVLAFLMMRGGDEEHAEGGDGHGGNTHAAAKGHEPEPVAAPRARAHDPAHPPTFVPLDPFTVNLADRDNDRYAQIGITLELDDPKIGDELKVYMPAVRNNILMLLSSKKAVQLMTREGKERLARQILYASVRPLGFPAYDFEADEEVAHDSDPAEERRRKKRQREQEQMVYPITAVHFNTFIIQ
jgi:flagellar FliL protein